MLKKISTQILAVTVILLLADSSLFAQKRLRFARGRTSTSASGRLAAGGKHSFVVYGRSGQQMSVRVMSANKRVSICETDGSGSDYELNETGDQRVEICNVGRATTYTLTISIR